MKNNDYRPGDKVLIVKGYPKWLKEGDILTVEKYYTADGELSITFEECKGGAFALEWKEFKTKDGSLPFKNLTKELEDKIKEFNKTLDKLVHEEDNGK